MVHLGLRHSAACDCQAREGGCRPGPQPAIGLPGALHAARPEPVDLVRREMHGVNVDVGADTVSAVLAEVPSGRCSDQRSGA